MSTYQEYLKWGWAVFPIAGPAYAKNKDEYKTWKEPLVYWQEYQERLSTLEEITAWEKKWPLAWVGCTTGPFSNLFVIDIDGEKGKDSLTSLKLQMPPTKISKTQRGFHYFFRWSPRMEPYTTTTTGLKPGIDIRGKGGCIILPSFHSKRSWVCDEMIAELPESWYAILSKNSSHSVDKNWRLKAMQELSDGNRHDTFLRLASSLMNAKWSGPEILAVLQPMADEQNFSEDIGALVEDVIKRYSPEGRKLQMQNKTRYAVSQMPVFTSAEMTRIKRTYPDMLSESFLAQDRFDREAVAWCTSDKIWQGSEAALALDAWNLSMQKLKLHCNL